jgi:hypothetical protein
MGVRIQECGVKNLGLTNRGGGKREAKEREEGIEASN